MRSVRPLLQALIYGLAALCVGYLSSAPAYRHRDPGLAQIKLALSHPGAHRVECHRRTAEELARLARNMRGQLECQRERVPVRVELAVDGVVVVSEAQRPAGLWKDGPSGFYRSFVVVPGRHTLTARLRDSLRTEGFDYEAQHEVDLRPRQNLVVAFRTETGGFTFE